MMSGEKRHAQEAFGSSNQLVVKRKKSDADLNPGTAVVKGSSQGGALVQAVCAYWAMMSWVKLDYGLMANLVNRSLVPAASMLPLWNLLVRSALNKKEEKNESLLT